MYFIRIGHHLNQLYDVHDIFYFLPTLIFLRTNLRLEGMFGHDHRCGLVLEIGRSGGRRLQGHALHCVDYV